jgi:uncharacterized protein (TIGR02145 family)
LATVEDWGALAEAVGSDVAGKKLKAKKGWTIFDGDGSPLGEGSGTDDFGFSALPGGLRSPYSGFDEAGGSGNWWADEEVGDARSCVMSSSSDIVDYNDTEKTDGFSVRCLKK